MYTEFYVGNLAFPSYGCLSILAALLVCIIAFLLAGPYGLSRKNLFLLILGGGIGAVFGAKIWTVIVECLSDGRLSKLSLKLIQKSGYSYFGAMLLGIAVLYLVARVKKINLDEYAEAFCFLVPLLHGIWKIGCFLGGCCYGVTYHGPFAVLFPPGVDAAGVYRFPIQLLEAFILFVLAVVFYCSGRKKSPHLIAKYVGIYSFFRFFTDFLRVHKTGYMLSDAQMASLVLMVVLVVCFVHENLAEKRMRANRQRNEREKNRFI